MKKLKKFQMKIYIIIFKAKVDIPDFVEYWAIKKLDNTIKFIIFILIKIL